MAAFAASSFVSSSSSSLLLLLSLGCFFSLWLLCECGDDASDSELELFMLAARVVDKELRLVLPLLEVTLFFLLLLSLVIETIRSSPVLS